MNDDIYLDNNATTMVDPQVVEAMLPYFTEQFGNPSSMHRFGDKVGRALKEARGQVQRLVGAERDDEIVFTSCGTEANSTALLSALEAQPERKEIITSVVEHPAILTVCEHLEKKGYTIHRIEVDGQGRINLDQYKAALSDQVAIASIMWANNETGTLFPVEEMAELAHAKGVMFHTDAVQAVGKVPIEIHDTKVDMLSLSGHKLHAPKGVGALYLRRGTRFRPLLRGGHQERGRRAGTENAASIVGLGVAAELAQDYLTNGVCRVSKMRDRLEQGILSQISHSFVTGDPENRVPNTANIAFEYIEGEAILLMLNHAGIAASSGSACTSGSLEPSHVLLALKVPFTAVHGSIRFSLSRYNTDEDIDRILEVFPEVVANLRNLSPYWDVTSNGPRSNADELLKETH